MMKAIILTLLTLVAATASGQERTLISGPVSHGGFGGPNFMLSRSKGQTWVMTGGWGAWVIDHTMLVGGGGYGLANDVYAGTDADGRDRYLVMGYGGLELGAVIASNRLVHLTAHTLLGSGTVSYRYHRWFDGFDPDDYMDTMLASDMIFVAQPMVEVELNVTRFFRIAAGAGYRFVGGVDLEGLTDQDMNNFTAGLTLKFGKF